MHTCKTETDAGKKEQGFQYNFGLLVLGFPFPRVKMYPSITVVDADNDSLLRSSIWKQKN